jgi:hypothetical protein
MYNITLICSVHREHGKCNSEELYNIIERIKPEIIFEEIPYFMYIEQYKEFSEKNLEIQAIKKYLKKYDVEQIPVDNLDLLNSLHNFEYSNEREINNNFVWRNLLEEQYLLESENGFEWINSDSCDNFFDKLYIQEKCIIKNSKKEKIQHLYNSWHEIQEKREHEMINNIYKYSNIYPYNKAIFLFGSGHRKSIIKLTQEYNKKVELKINWNINLK